MRKFEDLRARLDALLNRPDAKHPGQRDNIDQLRDDLEDEQDWLGERGELPGIVPWYSPRREVPYGRWEGDRSSVKTSSLMVRREEQGPVSYPRNGRAWRRSITRVRDNYELVVGGILAEGAYGSRRQVTRTAEMARVFGVGAPPPLHVHIDLFPDGGPGRMRRRARALYQLRKARRKGRAS